MATKRQRRRRDKERRHEYEYVYVDSEGREVEVEEGELPTGASNGKTPSPKAVKTGSGRTVEPPTWRRTLRRAAIFAPLIFLVLYLMRSKDATTAQVAFNTLVLMAFFVPFSYFMDSLMYRMAVKRGGKARQPTKADPRK